MDQMFSSINHHRTTANPSNHIFSEQLMSSSLPKMFSKDCVNLYRPVMMLLMLLMQLNQGQNQLADLSKDICSSWQTNASQNWVRIDNWQIISYHISERLFLIIRWRMPRWMVYQRFSKRYCSPKPSDFEGEAPGEGWQIQEEQWSRKQAGTVWGDRDYTTISCRRNYLPGWVPGEAHSL